MSPKALKSLAAAVAGLALLWGARAAYEGRAARPTLLFPGAEQAVMMTVADAAGAVQLRRTGGVWALESPFAAPADGPAMTAALGELARARLSGPLSDDPARLPLFALQDSSATRVTASGPGGSFDLLLGGPGAEASTVFVREPGSSVVREASGLSRGRLAARPGPWADKTLSSFDPTRVTKVSVRGPKGTVALERSHAAWPKLAPVLEALSKFSADDVLGAAALEAEPRVRLERVEFAVSVEVLDYAGAPGQPAVSFTVSPQGQEYRHLAKVKGRDSVVYSLSGWRLDPLRLEPKDFR